MKCKAIPFNLGRAKARHSHCAVEYTARLIPINSRTSCCSKSAFPTELQLMQVAASGVEEEACFFKTEVGPKEQQHRAAQVA